MTFIKKVKKREVGILFALFLAAFAIRSYRIQSHLFFGFEQGRDAQRILAILSLEDLVLVGPKTDIAGIFHGPWYYYLMTIPYGLSQGNPIVASLFLIFLSSFVPLIMFDLFKNITGKERFGWLAAVLTLYSYELVSYSRWLSNVTPAIPVMAVVLWLVWNYSKNPRRWLLIATASLSGFAAQFEIILSLWWLAFFSFLFATKTLKFPSLKTLLISLAAAAFWYLPLVIFNLRYSFISVTAASTYFANSEAGSFNLIHNLATYSRMIENAIAKTLFNAPINYVIAATLVIVIGVFIHWKKDAKSHSVISILLAWTLMTLPVIFFTQSMTLTQLYIGASLGIIGLTIVSVQGWLRVKWGGIALIALGLLWGSQTIRNAYLLHTNQDVFYVTIQDDLNYADQQKVLRYIQEKAGTNQYFLKAFTIPYYQEEGWQYLHSYFLKTEIEPGANQGFVIIEEKVDPYWRDQWQNDLGETTLEDEQFFGKLLVQYRKRVL